MGPSVEMAKLRQELPGIVAAARPLEAAHGIAETIPGVLPDGRPLANIIETVMPTFRAVPTPRAKLGPVDHVGFVVPVDDTSFRIFTVCRGIDRTFLGEAKARNAALPALTVEHRQRFPNDFEAQGGLGPMTLHSAEHLTRSDAGVIAVRRFFEKHVQAVEQGSDPVDVLFTPGSEYVRLEAGSFVGEAPSA